MPDFFSKLFSSDPPAQSDNADEPCESCPLEDEQHKHYKIVAVVSTRAGDIPLEGVTVNVDGTSIGKTNDKGKSGESPLRSKATADIEVIYENAGERLKREVYTLGITGISAESKSFTPGDANNFIAKVQDVFGSGDGGFGGDKDFTDTYSASGDVKMEDTDDPDVKLMTVTVKMATLSLQVPYLSQVGPGETIQTTAPTPANPAGRTTNFRGSIICMPTATKMCFDYWGITAAGGGDLSRNDLMQECWDEHENPTTAYPCPWQEWAHLRDVTGDLVEAAHPGVYTVDRGPAGGGGDAASIPSAYADGIVDELAAGKPVVTSTYATDGHVMTGRTGAFVRLDPRSGERLASSVVWATNAGGIGVSSPRPGTYRLTQGGSRAEVVGRVVTDRAGSLDFHGSVFIAKRPDALLRFRGGALTGETGRDTRPVGAMAVACDGSCLLTATNAEAAETFLWTLSPFDPVPVRLDGRVFLDGGEAALDRAGAHALLLSADGLRRIALRSGSDAGGAARPLDVRRARLSHDGRHALVADSVHGWRVFEAATMEAVAEPAWLAPDQTMAAFAPHSTHAVLSDAAGGMRLVEIPYEPLRHFDVDPEAAAPRFSATGVWLALRRDRGFTLFRSADGKRLAGLPGRTIVFTPDDRHAVTMGERVRLFRLGTDGAERTQGRKPP